jgi:hypothetical protein
MPCLEPNGATPDLAGDVVDRDELIEIARAIHNQRYGGAAVTFLAGSLVRGEGTATSDLDLVVVFEHVAHAYRESFMFYGKPVEAFVHDSETLSYFFSRGRDLGVPSLAAMVSEGIEIPSSSELSQSLKAAARQLLAIGPPAWGEAEVDASRYAITNFVDDLREPRTRAEQAASGAALYGALSTFYLRSRGLWAANDKTIPRQLRRIDPTFAEKFDAAFESLFVQGNSTAVIELTEQVLANRGGWLFDGYRVPAPPEWRSSQTAVQTASTDKTKQSRDR